MKTDPAPTGSHKKHAQDNSIACADCHNGYTDIAATPATHVDKSINLSFGGSAAGTTYAQGLTHAVGNGYDTCKTICHNDGTNTSAKVTPTWGTAVAACSACHAAVPSTGSHTSHLTGGYGIVCGNCHGDAVQGTTAPTGVHRNDKVNVYDVTAGDFGANYGAAGKDRGTAPSTCLSINCHGTSSPTWGVGYTGYDNCTVCHGEKTTAADGTTIAGATPEKVAPGGAGTDTGGNSAATSARVGAHQIHLTATDNYTTKILCRECHTVPATFGEAGHIDATLAWDGHATVDFPGNSTNNRALKNGATPSYNPSTGECSNVYCHGAKMINNSNNGTGMIPVWTNTAYLNGTPATAGDCGKCHGAPPTGYAPTSHTGSETLANCSGCHQHVNADGTFADKTLHMDGVVQAAGCTGCHGQPPVDAGTLVSNPAVTGHTQGAHATHWTTFSGSGCGICHAGGGTADAGHMTARQITIGFTYGQNLGTFNTTAYSNTFTAASGFAGTTVNNAQASITCSTVYCHGANMGANGGTNQTPNWTGGASQAACGTCHGATAAAAPTLGSHTKHASSGGYSLSCDTCHPTVSSGAHVNADVAWSISTSDARSNGGKYKTLASGTTGAIAPSGAYGSCATLYCHGNFGGNGNNATPTWGNTASGACGTCHDVDTSASMSGGSHDTHVKGVLGLTCDFCHKGTAVNAAGGILSTTLHVNGSLNWALDETKTPRITAGSTYRASHTGTRTTAQVGTTPYGSCGTIYCHSNVQTSPPGGALTYATPTWGGSVVCGDCHKAGNTGAGLQDSGSHAKHVSLTEYNIGCQQCHQGGGSGFATHANGLVNLSINGTWGGTYAGTPAPGDAYSTCSTVYCHSSGQGSTGGALAGGDYTSPAWGSGALNCGSCHKNMNSDAAATGNHVKHAQTAGIACATCHNGYTATTVALATHVNKTIDLSFSGTATGTAYSQGATHAVANGYGTCSTSACHSSGQGPAGLPAGITYGTPTWGGTLGCGSCHKDMDTDATAPGSHVKHAQGTLNYACAICHNGYTETTVNAATHNNASINLSFSGTAAGTTYSQGDTHPLGNGYGTCGTNYCHSNGRGTYVAPTWGGTSTGCDFCHPTLSGRHSSHVVFTTTAVYGSTSANVSGSTTNYDFGCGNCHPTAAASHANGTVDISLNPADGGTLKSKNVAPSIAGSGNTTQCNGVYCHSNGKASPAFVLDAAVERYLCKQLQHLRKLPWQLTDRRCACSSCGRHTCG